MKLICGFVRRFGHSCVRKIKPAKVCICGRNNCDNSLSRASNKDKNLRMNFSHLVLRLRFLIHDTSNKKIFKYSASGLLHFHEHKNLPSLCNKAGEKQQIEQVKNFINAMFTS